MENKAEIDRLLMVESMALYDFFSSDSGMYLCSYWDDW